MSGMFCKCDQLTGLDLSGFDTSKVTDMSSMFTWCNNLTELDVSSFDTSKVTDMGSMFMSCSKLAELNVSNFNTENVVYMNGIFAQTTALDTLALGEKSVFTQNPPNGNWTRYSTLDGAAADAPTYENLSDYDGSAPGWYSSLCAHEIEPTIVLSKSVFTYSGKTQRPSVTVKNGSTTLTEGVDYTVTYPDKSVNAGTYKVVVTLQGNYIGDNFETTYKIAAKKITPTVILTPAAFVYNGKVRKPAVTVKDGNTRLAPSNYAVKYPSGRKNPGAYKVTVIMKGNYSGTKTVSFKINPKGTALVSLTPASKKMTVKWKKQATQTTGYQIQYATDSKFTKNKKTVTVKGASATSKTITGLTGGKKYYVRIRTYKTVGKNKFYSSWSAAKATTVKR
jgi:surface protein